MTTVDVVIVNWNAGAQLRTCLDSIRACRPGIASLAKVVVIDNASADGSLDAIDGSTLPLEVHRNPENRGFGAACNQGVARGSADLVLFLNPDARLTPGAVDAAIGLLADRPAAGICGLALQDDAGHVQRTCCRIPSAGALVIKALGLDRISGGRIRSYPMEEWAHDRPRRVGHVIGACYFIRRSVFEELGGFDERFFVYLEDLDLSARAAARGWECWFLDSPLVHHRGGGTTDRIRATRLFYSLRSRLQYASKHFDRGGRTAVWCATLLAEPVVRVAFALVRLRATDLADTVKGFARLWGWAITRR